LLKDAMSQRQIMKDFAGIDTTCIHLGVAWVDEDSWREFLRYPEYLFVDSTHWNKQWAKAIVATCW
jgi:hypothetical protein